MQQPCEGCFQEVLVLIENLRKANLECLHQELNLFVSSGWVSVRQEPNANRNT
jgi:hypothetical protein